MSAHARFIVSLSLSLFHFILIVFALSLWSISFVFAMAAFATTLLIISYLVLDVAKWRWPLQPFIQLVNTGGKRTHTHTPYAHAKCGVLLLIRMLR